MTMMTSAYANKLLKKLLEDKEYWRKKESEGSTYIAAVDEEPIVPDYNYSEVAGKIEEIDNQMLIIKHAVNVNNVNNKIAVGDKEMSVDEILVRMAQLNKRKEVLDGLRKKDPKTRVSADLFNRKTIIEYKYINYDLDAVKKEYARIDAEISAMQLALDKYNQTFEFEVAI